MADTISIPILYEDDEVLVVSKPAGLVVHHDGKTKELSLSDWVEKNYPELVGVGEPLTLFSGKKIHKPGIVHRLDRNTSGVLIIAKTPESFNNLKKQFQERSIEKTYRAIVWGSVKKERGIIDRPIGRSRSDFRKKSAEYGARGELRPAVTEYNVLGRSKEFSYLEVYPKTGRTHQIRVHLKAEGHPVVCDKLYAPRKECPEEFSRIALHAYAIVFSLQNGTRIRVEAPVPPDMEHALAASDIS